MRHWLLAIATLFLYASNCSAAPSYLALCHERWNCSGMMQTWSGKPQITTGWIENTFNRECPCGDTLLKSPKPKRIRVHLINSPCMRNKRCGRYEALWGYNKISASRAVHVEGSRLNRRFNAILERFKKRLAAAHGDVQCYVSPCLECDLNGRARRALLNRVSVALPGCRLVDNPHRQRCVSGTICERHGHTVPEFKPCITDMDGLNGATVSVQNWVANSRQCAIRYYWEPWMNCIRGDFIDPRKRDCAYSKKQFTQTRGILCQFFYPSSGTCSR